MPYGQHVADVSLQTWQPDATLLAFLASVCCERCGADDNDEQLLLCDGKSSRQVDLHGLATLVLHKP